ncbi:MAG: hypothetical protein J6Y82_01675 [Bacteroidales bacterium]|nr:hypothetical protein [Bacteroidales bacterium]
MKKQITILTFAALALCACGGNNNQNQNGSESATDQAATDIEGGLPELVFDNLEFHGLSDATNVAPVVANAKKIVFKGDKMTISDGKNETVCQLDLNSSTEEANPDAYYWIFSTIGNDNLPETNVSIQTEYEEACIARNEDPKQRPIKIFFDTMGNLYPKNFNSWNNLRRKLASTYPSDEEYEQVLAYVNREEYEPEVGDYEDYNNGEKSVCSDINNDGHTDCISYSENEFSIYFGQDDDETLDPIEGFVLENENANSIITNVTIAANGDFKVETEWTNERGASGTDNYTARYHDGNFVLIAYDCTYEPATSDTYDLINFKKISESGFDEDDVEQKITDLKKLPLKKLSEIKIGEYHCDDYE